MEESVEFLDAVDSAARSEVISRRNVLRLFAQKLGGGLSREAFLAIALRLLEEAKAAKEANTRLRGLWMSASFLRELRGSDLLTLVRVELAKEAWVDLRVEDKAEYALGKALCLYYAGDRPNSLRTVNDILGDLESQGVTNSVYLSLLVGLGAIHISMGDYQSGVEISEKGLRIARKLGESNRAHNLTSNIALCYYRLEMPAAQVEWAVRSIAMDPENQDTILGQQACFLLAQAYAVRGSVGDAISALEQGTKLVERTPHAWVHQSWCLRTADVLTLLGRNSEALDSARRAVTGEMLELRTDSIAGPYARWAARIAVSDGEDVTEVRKRLEEMLSCELTLDRIDQAEVMNAKVWLDSKTGAVDGSDLEEMWRRLSHLPIGATNELGRLGMLEF